MRLSVSHLGRRLAAIGISVALLLAVIGVAPAAACDVGCSPGYWKTHTDMWPNGYTSSMTVEQAGFVFPAALDKYADLTLLQTLQGAGGPGVDGAAKILLRASVASLLNTKYFPPGWGVDPALLFGNTNGALASMNRARMLAWAAELDYFNNLLCPLN
jgi:hypothetical protein